MSNGLTESSDGTEICDLFATAYAEVYGHTLKPPDSVKQTYYTQQDITHDSFSTIEVGNEEIFQKLSQLDTSKGAGPDGISPNFIVNCARNLVAPLTAIFKKSFSSGQFPKLWKIAKVVPVFKSGDNRVVSNYRPISILSIFGKVLESLLCPRIQRYFEKFICEDQHGFVKARSTCTNLVSYIETLSEAMDAGAQVDAVYTDFSKAFDRVPHKILLDKLSMYGIHGSLLNWFKTYLCDREFYVVVNGFRSACYAIASGVPQGSHLGPILFIIFINDVITCFHNTTPFLFADDMKIVKKVTSPRDTVLIQQDLDRLSEWCSRNQMLLNCTKCVHIKFSRKLRNIDTTYNINETPLTEVNCIKDLGVTLDSKLTFVPHVDCIIKRGLRALGFVIRNSKLFRKSETKILLYCTLVRSVLEYCSAAWRPHYAVHCLRIERVQKRFLNYLGFSVGKKIKRKSYSYKLALFKMKSLEKRRDILDLRFIYKLLRNKTDCPKLLSKVSFRAPCRLPRKPITPLVPPFRRTKSGTGSPIPRMCKLVNENSDLNDIHTDTLEKFIRNTSIHNMIS